MFHWSAKIGDLNGLSAQSPKVQQFFLPRQAFLPLIALWTFKWIGMLLFTSKKLDYHIYPLVIIFVVQILPSLIFLMTLYHFSICFHIMCREIRLPNLKHFAAIVLIGSSIGQSIELLTRVFSGQCERNGFKDIWGCNPSHSAGSLPLDSFVCVLINPILFNAFVPTIDPHFLLASQGVGIGAVLVAAIHVPSAESIWSVVFGSCLCYIGLRHGIIAYSTRDLLPPAYKINKRATNIKVINPNNSKSSFSVNNNSPCESLAKPPTPVRGAVSPIFSHATGNNSGLYVNPFKLSGKSDNGAGSCIAPCSSGPIIGLVPNEMLELKTLIANAAHDLKTPLSAFMHGIEIATQVVNDMSSRLSQCSPVLRAGPQSQSLRGIKEDITTLISALHSMSNTNSFMLMSINRTIDFSKASNGIVLVPRNESFAIREVIDYSMNCVKDLNPGSNVFMSPIPQSIAKTIVTDKQWLTDNLLCLISNAVKYSPIGNDVRIEMHLRKREELPKDGSQSSPNDRFRRVSDASNKIQTLLHGTSNRLPSGMVLEKSAVFHETTLKMLVESRKSCDSVESGETINRNVLTSENDSRLSSSKELMIYVAVEDNGIGIPDEVTRKAIFTGMQPTGRLSGGAGLGLRSLSLRMDALGGQYGCNARRDFKTGSVFWFAFPYIPDPVDEHGGVVTTPHTNTTAVPSLGPDWSRICRSFESTDINESEIIQSETINRSISGSGCLDSTRTSLSGSSTARMQAMKILVVDDSPSILKMSSAMLRRKGYEVETAINGLDAVNKFENAIIPFDVILMDLQMPVMDGLEAMRRIRQWEKDKKVSSVICEENDVDEFVDIEVGIPPKDFSHGRETRKTSTTVLSYNFVRKCVFIVGVSACSDSGTVEEAFVAGADVFIAKPFTMDSFHQATKQLHEDLKCNSSLEVEFN